MANKIQQQIIRRGVDVWNKWRKSFPSIKEPDLSGINLSKKKLSGANLAGAHLASANLEGADLTKANLDGAYLVEANLSGAILERASLRKTTLRATNVSKANLTRADLQGALILESYFNSAILPGADLRYAQLIKTNLHEADLTGANLYKVNLSMSDLTYTILSDANLQEAFLLSADLSFANLYKADLRKALLTSARMVQTNFEEATISECNVYGISAWDLNLNNTRQENLIISQTNEPTKIMVDNLEVAQFIYLLLNHEKLRDVFNTVTERGVLILGRFGGGGLEVLQSVAKKLREMGYLPIIFDFERPEDRNFTETVKTLVGLSRFVIVDLSGPSVPQELYATVPHFKIPFVPIIETGRNIFAMLKDILEYPWVINPPIEFESIDQLIELIPTSIVGPAEEKLKERQRLFAELFNR